MLLALVLILWFIIGLVFGLILGPFLHELAETQPAPDLG